MFTHGLLDIWNLAGVLMNMIQSTRAVRGQKVVLQIATTCAHEDWLLVNGVIGVLVNA